MKHTYWYKCIVALSIVVTTVHAADTFQPKKEQFKIGVSVVGASVSEDDAFLDKLLKNNAYRQLTVRDFVAIANQAKKVFQEKYPKKSPIVLGEEEIKEGIKRYERSLNNTNEGSGRFKAHHGTIPDTNYNNIPVYKPQGVVLP